MWCMHVISKDDTDTRIISFVYSAKGIYALRTWSRGHILIRLSMTGFMSEKSLLSVVVLRKTIRMGIKKRRR